RNTPLGSEGWRPPRGAVALPMAALFGVAGAGLTGIGLMQVAFGDTGMIGANLSAGGVALVAAAACAIAYGRQRSAPR
ncbi:MAG TPA: hypothetical protein VGJ63_17860, partial [Micromonosporaceae bacterium]